jgi:hypothetical protein
MAIATATWNVSASGTVIDLYAFLMSSSVPADQTPPHQVVLQNNGAGSLRVGAPADISINAGLLVGPGETFRLRLSIGNRLGLVGDGGLAAPAITVLLQVGV